MERHESGLRWIVLFLGCLGLFGSYYCYDIPSSLKDQIQDQLSLDETEFNLLYT